MFNQRVLNTFKDREKIVKWLETHRSSLQAWGVFSLIVIIIFVSFSDGDFSFLLTLSSIISLFSFAMIIFKIETTQQAKGISLVMIECYVLLLTCRLFSIIPFEGYLPYDRSGDWLYQLTEAISFCLAGTIVYLCHVRYRSSYSADADTVRHLYLVVPALILAVLFHPNLNAFMPADIAWTFALYLEAICCLPQLFMFQKQGRVEPFTTHFLAAQALSKVISFIFWAVSFSELNDSTKRLKSFAGVWVIVMQLIQLLVMGDFIYHYLRCVTRGVPVEYILEERV